MATWKYLTLILMLCVSCAVSSGCFYSKPAILVGPNDPVIPAEEYIGPAWVYDANKKLRFIKKVRIPAGRFSMPFDRNMPGVVELEKDLKERKPE